MIDLHHGDALDVFRSVRGLAAIVADLPGGGEFMGLKFDHHLGGRDAWIRYWAERLRVAREATERGSWGLFWAFGRTAHWTACALDDAGWEIVRPILHVHGEGWAKAKSQLKPAQEIWWLCRWGGVTPLQIDRCRVRRSWAERPESWFRSGHSAKPEAPKIAAPPGHGIEIHPGGSWAPDLVLSHCPACREVGSRKVRGHARQGRDGRRPGGFGNIGAGNGNGRPCGPLYGDADVPAWECLAVCSCGLASLAPSGGAPSRCPGCGNERWWACPVAEMDGQSGERRSAYPGNPGAADAYAGTMIDTSGSRVLCKTVGVRAGASFADSGGASRFFPTFHYDAKASTRERQAGCEGLLWVRDDNAPIGWRRVSAEEHDQAPDMVPPRSGRGKPRPNKATGNVHATIKPVGLGAPDGLMRWLVRLVTPPGGRVGDITLGSGGTGLAAQVEGHDFTGCDVDPGCVDIARARLAFWTPERHRQVLADSKALKAHERALARERATKEVPHHDDLPLFGGAL